MSGISVSGYQMNFRSLTKKLFEEDRDKYNKMLYAAKVEEARKGFVATRINKANSSGTKVTFSCADTFVFDEYCRKLNEEYETLFASKN